MARHGGRRAAVRLAALAGAVGALGGCNLFGFLLSGIDCEVDHGEFAKSVVSVSPFGADAGLLAPEDGAAGDRFGHALAVDDRYLGLTVVVGAPSRDEGDAQDSGAVYAFRKSSGTWKQIGKLTAPAPSAGDRFGTSVALAYDLLVVGAPGDDDDGTDAGAAYVFRIPEGNDWTGLAPEKLVIGSPAPGAAFGRAVETNGAAIFVGAPLDQTDGRVRVFESVQGVWTRTSLVPGGHSSLGESFGTSLAWGTNIDGPRLFAGAPGYEGIAAFPGRVFEFDGSVAPTGLTSYGTIESDVPPSIQGVDQFRLGLSVDAAGGGPGAPLIVAVGGLGHAAIRSIAHNEMEGTWRPLPRNGASFFGAAVAVLSDSVAVGAPGGPTELGEVRIIAPGSGRSYASPYWESGNLDQTLTLRAQPGSLGNAFGSALASIDKILVVGAPGQLSDGVPTGAAYLYQQSARPAAKRTGAETTSVANTYLAFKADDDATSVASGTIRLDRDLWPPFWWDVKAGLFDESRRSGVGGGQVGVEIEVLGSSPREFVALNATFVTEGLRIGAATETGPKGSFRFLTRAERAVLTFALDGTEAVLSARDAEGTTTFEIARVPFATAGRALRQCGTASGLGAGGEVGWDDSEVAATGSPPEPLPPAAAASEGAARAMDLQFQAAAILESGSADRETPAAHMADSLTRLDAARKAVAGLPRTKRKPTSGPALARKQLALARRQIRTAARLLAKGRAVDKVTARIYRALRAEQVARHALVE